MGERGSVRIVRKGPAEIRASGEFVVTQQEGGACRPSLWIEGYYLDELIEDALGKIPYVERVDPQIGTPLALSARIPRCRLMMELDWDDEEDPR